MTDTISIPLNKLTLWHGNVRRTGASDGIVELAASISAHGLLQSLVVRKGKRGKYDVVAGQRRLLAMTALVRHGQIAADYPVPCIIAAAEIGATELSLAENVVRAPMHPADQFEAFNALLDNGATVIDVAARFGIPDTVVAKRMKLGRLSPVILEAYREGDLNLDQAQAFAVTDDHAAQERVHAELIGWNCQPHTIRRALTSEEIPTTDKRVRFIGADAYRAAGGVMRQDLFCDDDTGYLQDAAIVNRLVTEKLTTIATDLSGEGWLWVDIAPDADYQMLSRFDRLRPERVPLPDEQQAELERLSDEYDTLVDSDDEADTERLAGIQQRIDDLTASSQVWAPESLAMAGALVTLDYDGDVRIERGLVRPEDRHRVPAPDDSATEVASASDDAANQLSASLVQDLTAQKSAAISAELRGKPDIALAAVVHALLLGAFYPGYRGHTCVDLGTRAPSLRSSLALPDQCAGLDAIERERDRLANDLPESAEMLWDWCLARTRDELLDMLAVLASGTLNAVRLKADRANQPRLVHADALARALGIDMTAWFKPTAAGYFSRVSKTQILAAIDEAKGAHAPWLDKHKKSELAITAEQLLEGTGWLPEPVRIAAGPEVLSNDDSSDSAFY